MKPHKHAELIKAWADGAEIQVNDIYGWVDCPHPKWAMSIEYRIKPEPKPDRQQAFTLMYDKELIRLVPAGGVLFTGIKYLLVTLDGETGELKSAEVLK